MQVGEAQVLHRGQGIFEHCLGFGREPGDQVGAENGVGPRLARPGDDGEGVGAAVAALHALEHRVVHGLKAEMKVRHQPLFFGEQPEQVVVDGGRVEGAEAQALQLRHRRQQTADETAKAALAIGAVGADIDAGQHHFQISRRDQGAYLIGDGFDA